MNRSAYFIKLKLKIPIFYKFLFLIDTYQFDIKFLSK